MRTSPGGRRPLHHADADASGRDRRKAFADATGERWYNRAWLNKIAAGFTISGLPSGGKLSTRTA